MIEDTKIILIEVVLFVFFIILMIGMVGSSECKGIAENTASDLADSIDKVSSPDFKTWTADGMPTDQDEEYFEPVAMRLCQENTGPTGLGAAWRAQIPNYQIVFEHFPEAEWSDFWDESTPWSGGAGATLMFLGAVRYAPKVLMGSYYITKAAITGTIKIPAKVIVAINKINKFLKNIANKFRIKRLASRSDTVQAEILGKRYLFSQNWRGRLKVIPVEEGLASASAKASKVDTDELIKRGGLAVVSDPYSPNKGKYIFTDNQIEITGLNKKITARDFGSAIKKSITSVEELEKFDEVYVVPKKGILGKAQKTKWRIGSRFRAGKKAISDKIWTNSRLRKSIVIPLRNTLGGVKKKLRRAFHLGVVDTPADNIEQSRQIRRMFLEDTEIVTETGETFGTRKITKDMITERWNDESEDLFRKAFRESTGLTDISKLEDKHVITFLLDYENKMSFSDLLGYIPQSEEIGIENIKRMNGYEKGYKIFKDDAYKHASTSKMTKQEKLTLANDFKTKWGKDWGGPVGTPTTMTTAEKQAFVDLLNDGVDDIYKFDLVEDDEILRRTYTDLQDSIDAVPFSRTNTVLNEKKIKKMLSTLSESKSKAMFEAGNTRSVLLSKFESRLISPSWFSTLAGGTAGTWRRSKRYAYYKFGARLNPINILGGRQITQIAQERIDDQCQGNSICLISLAGSDMKNYPLERNYEVKLWRPKPDLGERTPVPLFISTAWMHNSIKENPRFYTVSPCFGVAKVWKADGVIYVGIPRDENGDLDLAEIKNANDAGNQYPTSNYCYADYNYIWGRNNDPAIILSGATAEFAGIYAACTLGSLGTGAGHCVKIAGYAVEGTLFAGALTVAESEEAVHNPPESNSGWGYFSYYGAADVCDFYDIIAGFGLKSQVKAGSKTGKLGKKTYSKTLAKSMQKTGANIGDLCTWIEIIGESSLSWPVRSSWPPLPLAPEGSQKNKPLDEDDIEKWTGKLVYGE